MSKIKKELQVKINLDCIREYLLAKDEIKNMKIDGTERLRKCKAKVITTPSYYCLVSYNTLVAVINKSTKQLYDILRYVYGYTSTSAQHISKFAADYLDKRMYPEAQYFRYYDI